MTDMPLSIFCYQGSTYHPLFSPSVISSLLCFTLVLIYFIPPQNLNMIPSLASSKEEIASSFSWTSLFESPTSTTSCFADPTLADLNQVKLLCESDFCITKSIRLRDPVVHTGATFLLTSKTLPHKPKMYLQDLLSKKPHLSILPKSTSHC